VSHFYYFTGSAAVILASKLIVARMAFKNIIIAAAFLGLSLAACTDAGSSQVHPATAPQHSTHPHASPMRSYISMFEIPATDVARAIGFYEALLDIQIEQMDVEGMQMGIWPYEGQMVTGVIVQADGYKPSADGVTMYLHAGDDLQAALAKVEQNGGKIITPKTAHADGSGYFALFLDSEGNRMALNATN
jgi:hypothetical protein